MKKLIALLLPLILCLPALAEDVAADAQPTLLSQGLIVTAGGLIGVFMVLVLFFLTIKLLQKAFK